MFSCIWLEKAQPLQIAYIVSSLDSCPPRSWQPKIAFALLETLFNLPS